MEWVFLFVFHKQLSKKNNCPEGITGIIITPKGLNNTPLLDQKGESLLIHCSQTKTPCLERFNFYIECSFYKANTIIKPLSTKRSVSVRYCRANIAVYHSVPHNSFALLCLPPIVKSGIRTTSPSSKNISFPILSIWLYRGGNLTSLLSFKECKKTSASLLSYFHTRVTRKNKPKFQKIPFLFTEKALLPFNTISPRLGPSMPVPIRITVPYHGKPSHHYSLVSY